MLGGRLMRNRVFTYITRPNELLVFDHVDRKFLAPQVPGGTVEYGEEPAEAALREANEETGLVDLRIVSFLGSFRKDLRSVGRDETIYAWFYHLETEQETPSRWKQVELDPSEGTVPIEFELYWVPLLRIPKLGGIDDAMLTNLQLSMGRATAKFYC
jgi:8-oxo-dGTP pyrophosphatase MutT (NUDIX family)